MTETTGASSKSSWDGPHGHVNPDRPDSYYYGKQPEKTDLADDYTEDIEGAPA